MVVQKKITPHLVVVLELLIKIKIAWKTEWCQCWQLQWAAKHDNDMAKKKNAQTVIKADLYVHCWPLHLKYWAKYDAKLHTKEIMALCLAYFSEGILRLILLDTYINLTSTNTSNAFKQMLVGVYYMKDCLCECQREKVERDQDRSLRGRKKATKSNREVPFCSHIWALPQL